MLRGAEQLDLRADDVIRAKKKSVTTSLSGLSFLRAAKALASTSSTFVPQGALLAEMIGRQGMDSIGSGKEPGP